MRTPVANRLPASRRISVASSRVSVYQFPWNDPLIRSFYDFESASNYGLDRKGLSDLVPSAGNSFSPVSGARGTGIEVNETGTEYRSTGTPYPSLETNSFELNFWLRTLHKSVSFPPSITDDHYGDGTHVEKFTISQGPGSVIYAGFYDANNVPYLTALPVLDSSGWANISLWWDQPNRQFGLIVSGVNYAGGTLPVAGAQPGAFGLRFGYSPYSIVDFDSVLVSSRLLSSAERLYLQTARNWPI